jgi:hypothetical protein
LRVKKETGEIRDEHCLHAFMVGHFWCVA